MIMLPQNSLVALFLRTHPSGREAPVPVRESTETGAFQLADCASGGSTEIAHAGKVLLDLGKTYRNHVGFAGHSDPVVVDTIPCTPTNIVRPPRPLAASARRVP